MEHILERQVADSSERMVDRSRHPVSQHLLRQGQYRLGFRSLQAGPAQERTHSLVVRGGDDSVNRHFAFGHADRSNGNRLRSRSGHPGLFRGPLSARLGRCGSHRIPVPPKRKRFLQDHAVAHRHDHVEHGFFGHAAGSATGQYRALRTVLSRDPRFFPAGRGIVRVRRPAAT